MESLRDLFGGRAAGRFLNTLLFASAVFLCVRLYHIWTEPLLTEADRYGKGPSALREDKPQKAFEEASYGVIVEKDIFSPTRRKYAPPPPPRPQPPRPQIVLPPPPPPKRPPPKLSLTGTVLLNDGEAALLEYGGKSSHYMLGDNIEGFIVTDIRKDSVVLERDGEALKVEMTPSNLSGQPNRPKMAQPSQNAAAQVTKQSEPQMVPAGTPLIPE